MLYGKKKKKRYEYRRCDPVVIFGWNFAVEPTVALQLVSRFCLERASLSSALWLPVDPYAKRERTLDCFYFSDTRGYEARRVVVDGGTLLDF